MATFVLFDDFGLDLGSKVHNLTSDTLQVVLSNSAPNQATGSVIGDITQISAGNGYSTGGQALDSVTYAETSAGSGVWRLNSSDEVFTASGGSIAQFRYIVLYNNTAASDEVIGYLDYGSAVDVTVGNTFTIDLGANGWFELTIP
jgi:hypothetical protein